MSAGIAGEVPIGVVTVTWAIPGPAGVVAVAPGFFLISEKDPVDVDALATRPPAAAGPVGALSIYVPREKVSRVVHSRLAGEFIELQGKQKIPLRLPPVGWADLDVICDQLGIPRS